MSKSAVYNEALSHRTPAIRCRNCRKVITTVNPGDPAGNVWWKHVTTGLMLCALGIDSTRLANPMQPRRAATVSHG
jgi:hypothetical protein